ncbi:MAG: lysophospholipid acyltransferase family protein [Microbacteriaceae bacterium]
MRERDRPAASAGPSPRVRSERLRAPFFWLLAAIVLPVMNASVRWDIRDGHKLPKQGAFILVPNHYTQIDPVVTGIALWRMGRVPRFLAKASLFRVPVLGAIMRASGQIPVERGAGRGADPLAAAGHLLTRGNAIIIYPEGTLTREPDLWPMRGRAGAVRAALEHGIPIIPMAHWGSQGLMARYGKRVSLFQRKPVQIIIGDPIDLSAVAGRTHDKTALEAGSAQVMHEVARLLGELRGETPPAELWDPAKHDQKETGRP